MKVKKLCAILIASCFLLTACGTGGNDEKDNTQKPGAVSTGSNEPASTNEKGDPLAPYAEEVTLHMGAGLNSNVKFPEGQTMEKNDFLDIIKNELNIKVVYDWISSDYNQKINLCISSNTLPDAMNINETQYRSMLKYGQLQDITEPFDNGASDTLKGIVKSGGQALQDLITADGKMMAIPAPNLKSAGVTTMWIRQDWLDKLGLNAPKTLDDLKAVAKAFITRDPDGNNKADTLGIIGPNNTGALCGIGGTQFSFDPIFGAYKSFPKYWLKDDSGNVIYGSTTEQTKQALAELAQMYKDGLIDPEILGRSDSTEPVLAGKAGIFFGPWWTGYTIIDSVIKNQFDWQAYATPLAEDGKFYSHMAPAASQYVVVSKNCKNPEAAAKIISLLLRDEQKWIASGITKNLPTSDVYPLYNVYDNADEAEFSYDVLKKWLKGEIKMEDVDFTGHKLLKGDMEAIKPLKLEPVDNFSAKYWDVKNELAQANLGRFVSFFSGMRPLMEDGYEEVYGVYYGTTKTMESKWANLAKMEDQAFAKIVLGQASIDTFDKFVKDWNAQGGQEIIKEITESIKK